MPVFDTTENTMYGIFTADNAKYWIPAIIGIIIVLYLIYRYYYSGNKMATLKRY